MLDRESYALVELLGREDPQVQALLFAARNETMRGSISQLLRSLCRERGINPDDPPMFGLPTELSPSDYPIAHAKCGELIGDEVGPSDEELYGHMGFFGVTRYGKSTTVKMLLLHMTSEKFSPPKKRPFLILDMDGEYRDLLPHYPPDELVWMTADDLCLNPLEPPTQANGAPAMSPDKWLGLVREWLRLNWLNDPSLNHFAEVVMNLYKQNGVLDGGTNCPCIGDVIEALKSQVFGRGSDRARSKDKLVDRLTAMRSMLPGLDVRRSRDIQRLFGQRSVILDLVETNDIALPLLFNLLVMLFRCSFEAEPNEPASRIMVIEEAHRFLGGQVDKRTSDLGESRGTGILRSIRKAGYSGWVVNQLVSDIHKAVTGNLSTIFCFQLKNNACVNQAKSILTLERWQQQEPSRLPAREAIIRLSRYPAPIHVVINDASEWMIKPEDVPGREEARARSKPVLDSIPFLPPPEPDETEGVSGVAADDPRRARQGKSRPTCTACQKVGISLKRGEHRTMGDICERPASSIPDRCDRLRMAREEESVARRAPTNMGLLRQAGVVGNRRVLHEPTDKGREWASAHAIEVPSYHGSVAHEFTRRKAEERLAEAAPGIRFIDRGSGAPGGVRPDSIGLLPGREGRRLALQAVVAHRPKEEALNLLKLCGEGPQDAEVGNEPGNGTGWIDLVLSIAISRRVQKRVEEAVKELNGGEIPPNLIFIDAESLLAGACDLSWVLERDV